MGFRALVLLGYHFLKHLLRKATFLYNRGGSKRFVTNYLPDKILPIETPVREALPSWQTCIACGLCDAAYGDPAVSVMAVVASGVRDFSTMEAVAPQAAALDDEAALVRAEAACPSQIPIRDVVAYIREAPQRFRDSGV